MFYLWAKLCHARQGHLPQMRGRCPLRAFLQFPRPDKNQAKGQSIGPQRPQGRSPQGKPELEGAPKGLNLRRPRTEQEVAEQLLPVLG